MKRASLILSALALAFTLACGDSYNNNKNTTNGNGNTNYNLNANSNPTLGGGGSSGGGITAGDPSVITIAVVVCYDANRAVQVRITEPVHISSKNQQKVRWCVYNNLDISLNSVTIGAFNSGGSTTATLCTNSPNLTTGSIPPGNFDAVCTEYCATALLPSGTSFQYTVTARPSNLSDAILLGPRVVIQ